MQVDPIKPMLTPPIIKRLVSCDEVVLSFAFNFYLCRYNKELFPEEGKSLHRQGGDHATVGRCRVTPSKSVLKGPMVSALEARI